MAAANAAFLVLKNTVMAGKDLASAGSAINSFVFSKEELGRQTRKQRSKGKNVSELESFLALEEIKRKEDQLREMMQLYGRSGLWNDWQKYQAEARKSRQVQRMRAQKRREEMIEIIGWGIGGLLIASFIAGLFYYALIVRGYIK